MFDSLIAAVVLPAAPSLPEAPARPRCAPAGAWRTAQADDLESRSESLGGGQPLRTAGNLECVRSVRGSLMLVTVLADRTD